ncbi:MAG: DUF6734 family protein [Dysgonomonas sp.]|nr:DUF6734 family protein [Dysgonomonas sp.]
MRAVQTLWTSNKNLLEDGFGWIHPQYNLMSWALSCLSLKEHYDDVVLYTDSNGYNILHNYLGLPYKEIIVQYDDLNCHPDLWAYAKLFTYSIQDKPFIHVDGDVYLPHKLPKNIESGELIAQNEEIGTEYYKYMINAIVSTPISIPYFLFDEIKKESISSYNAGVLGGNNLEFIKEYCDTAFEFIEKNGLKNVDRENININYNILFEQILFHALAAKKNKKISTILDHSINDNGYTNNEFCNFYSFDKSELMHIIGGHKKNLSICELLERTLLYKYPEYYKKIIDMFPQQHIRLGNIQSYMDFVNTLSKKWSKISKKQLFDQEKKSCNYFRFVNDSKQKQNQTIIKRNPYLSIYEIPQNWNTEEKKYIRDRIFPNFYPDNFDIACVPGLLHQGYREILIDNLSYNILILLEEHLTLKELIKKLTHTFPAEIKNNKKLIDSSIPEALEYLFYHKLIYID